MRVLIVGGGIAGLTTALSLHAAGYEAIVFEAVSRVDPLGLGINLQPNAVRELLDLGLGDMLAKTAIPTANIAYYNRFGQQIWIEPRGLAAGYRWPQYSVHRGELQAGLLEAVVARLGSDAVKVGHHFQSFEDDGNGVTATFLDRERGTQVTHRGDVLVGADGIHSAVRRQFYPNEGGPVFSGRTQWRGAVEVEPYLDGKTQVVIGNREVRAVLYPMSGASAAKGKALVNWLTLATVPELDKRESWDRRVSKDRFFEFFKDWNYDWIQVGDIISQTTDIYEYPETDRDPIPKWSFNRVTLVGDAAHPMRAVGSQAGSQAVVDARVLVYELANTADPVRALQAYEDHRLPAVNGIIGRNREMGPEIVMQIAEDRAPTGFDDIDKVIPYKERADIALSFKVAAGFDPETLNARPSLNVSRTH